MRIKLKIWRQAGPQAKGAMRSYKMDGVSEHMSFLEMLDVLNEQLLAKGEDPVAFDHDCREGICRYVQFNDKWHCAWSRKGDDCLPAAHA